MEYIFQDYYNYYIYNKEILNSGDYVINLIEKLKSNETIIELIHLKEKFLKSDDFQRWVKYSDEAKLRYKQILNEADFKEKRELTNADLDEMFRLMKKLSSNRSLSKLIYEENTLNKFNKTLWALYYGEEPLPKRIDAFLNLSKIGEQSTSQFLVMYDDTKFPISTDLTQKILSIDTEIEEEAKKLAIKKYNIENPNEISSRTLSYLTYMIIYGELKNILDVDKIDEVNKLLWKYGLELGEEPDDDFFATLGLETDLRKFLASNPDLIEKGLVLVEDGEEFDTHDVGRIDLLFKDSSGTYVVVELKRRKTGDQVVGQILRYIGWVQDNLSPNVRGIIIIGEPYEKLDYALKPIEDIVQLKYYRVKFEITDTFQE